MTHRKINLHKATLSTLSLPNSTLHFQGPNSVPQLHPKYDWLSRIKMQTRQHQSQSKADSSDGGRIRWNLSRTYNICMQLKCMRAIGETNNLTNSKGNDIVKLPDSHQYQVSDSVPTHISCLFACNEWQNSAKISAARVDQCSWRSLKISSVMQQRSPTASSFCSRLCRGFSTD